MEVVQKIIEEGKEVVENTKEVIEGRKELIEELFEKTEEYLKTNLELLKFKTADKMAGIISNLVSQIAIVLLGFIFFLMLNIGIAMWLGKVMGESYYGFMVLAAFYLLLTIIVVAFRNSLIKHPISHSIISQVLK